ncbi:MAG: DUF4178 domain-containing protein [Pseudomonadota bacterium]
MQTVSCPSCGAPVEFRSHASVMAVCGYCNASVLKDADAVKDLGKMSSVLEDFSPIQIGTAGVVGSRHFTVVGRIQLRYSAGMWNEWYLLFDDASTSWLGDSSGMFTITTAVDAAGELPAFDAIVPGNRYNIGSDRFTASEKRMADCIGGQGELPFRVGEGYQARVADFRNGSAFVTLDYSDEQPVLYNGLAVTLEEMQCQLLRDDEQIKASAGKYRGKLDALDCPSCGTAIKYLPGITPNLVCPGCATQLDATGPEAQVLAAGERVEAMRTTIALGAQAKINGSDYQVIGAMVRADEENTEWTEYLLYSTRNSFFWLVETAEGWSRANVMFNWPDWSSIASTEARLDKVVYKKLYDYRARVLFAAGAFNWRVAAGDEVGVSEFANGQTRLAAELTNEEMTWSRSVPVAFDQIAAWFGSDVRADANRAKSAGGVNAGASPRKFMWWILGLNAIPLLLNFGASIFYVVLAILAIYLPYKYLESDDKGKS